MAAENIVYTRSVFCIDPPKVATLQMYMYAYTSATPSVISDMANQKVPLRAVAMGNT